MSWDYDKLFAVGNLVWTVESDGTKMGTVIDDMDDMSDYENDFLIDVSSDGYQDIIIYILAPQKDGTLKTLFNRNIDKIQTAPDLTNGIFVEVDYSDESYIGVIVNDNIVYENGEYDELSNLINKIIRVWGDDVCAFNHCKDTLPIWEKK